MHPLLAAAIAADILLTGGRVLDGAGNPWIRADIAIRGMTSLPAGFFSVPDRGLLKPGFFADVAVFDESKIRDLATYEEPRRFSEGTVHVLVNGRFAFRDGKPTGNLAGRPIPRPSKN